MVKLSRTSFCFSGFTAVTWLTFRESFGLTALLTCFLLDYFFGDRFLADRSFADGFFALGTDSTETGLVSTGTAVFIGPPNRVFVILNDINRLYFCSA